MTVSLTNRDLHTGSEARKCGIGPQQLVPGEVTDAERIGSARLDLSVQASRKRKAGRRGRARSMGRYPWVTCTRRYLEAVQPYFEKKTHDTMRRGLKTLGDAFAELKKEGKASANPEHLTQEDIEALLNWMKTRKTRNGVGLRPATQANYLTYLQHLLVHVNNPVLDRMRLLRHVRFPSKCQPEIRSLSEETVERIRGAMVGMPGWDGCVARFMVAMYPYSGLRRSELRRARIQDLDTTAWTIKVVHPKGENRYASAGTATILPPARQAVLDFLAERENLLAEYGVDEFEVLVPHVSGKGELMEWSDGMWGSVKDDAVKWAGIHFSIQSFRATFAQMCKDRGASIEAVSKALRHRNTKTTELYYARIRGEKAFQELEQAWVEKP